MEIDLNCDLGEGSPFDAALMPLITSANICCGAHAGDAATAHATLELAKTYGVQVGAHPGFADREHFGRRELTLTRDEISTECRNQVGTLAGLAKALEIPLKYIKPHGALYNMACRDLAVAAAIVESATMFCLPVMGLPNSQLQAACLGKCSFIAEGFADRRYRSDGSLVPRGQPGAFITEPDEAVAQLLQMLNEHRVQTICVHGDNPKALLFVRKLREVLAAIGVAIRACS